jgi:fluoroacetyl-CoA thioesterase
VTDSFGSEGAFALTVTSAHLANQFKDAILPEVFATPMMVLTRASLRITRLIPLVRVRCIAHD